MHKDWYCFTLPKDPNQQLDKFKGEQQSKWEFVYLKRMAEEVLVSTCTCQPNSDGMMALLRSPSGHEKLAVYNMDQIIAETDLHKCPHQQQVRARLSGEYALSEQFSVKQTTAVLSALPAFDFANKEVDFSKYNEPCVAVDIANTPRPPRGVTCVMTAVIPLSRESPAIVTCAHNSRYRSKTYSCHQCVSKQRACVHVKFLKQQDEEDGSPKVRNSKTGLGTHSVDPETHKLKPTCLSTGKIPDPPKMDKQKRKALKATMASIVSLSTLQGEEKTPIILPLPDTCKRAF
jgi:hypothetical protein